MSDSTPPRGMSSSPSIFAYQTRLLDRLSSPPPRASSSSAADSPIKRSVAQMSLAGAVGPPPADDASHGVPRSGSARAGMGMGGRPDGHMKGSKSIDLVRGQWEAKINEASAVKGEPKPSWKSARPKSVVSPPIDRDVFRPSSSMSSSVTSPSIASPAMASDNKPSASTSFRGPSSSASSYPSVLSPDSTGTSSVASQRSAAMEDTLAQARANALRRAEERRKAKSGGAAAAEEATTPAVISPVSAAPAAEAPPVGQDVTPKKGAYGAVGKNSTPTPRSIGRIVSPPSATPTAIPSSYVPSGLSTIRTPDSGPSNSSTSTERSKYGSLSTTDRRRLGRHLPRVASGEYDGEDTARERAASGRPRVPSALAQSAIVGKDRDTPPSSPIKASASGRVRAQDIFAPSQAENKPAPQAVAVAPSGTPSSSKRRSTYKPITPQAFKAHKGELQGEEMKGLMSAVGALSTKGDAKRDEDVVGGMSNRLRLAKSVLPPAASSASLAPAPLPSKRLVQTNWMDRRRKDLAAYEYLCHVGEAQQWVEGCLEQELGFGVTEMEHGLRDGIALAKLAQAFQGEHVVKRIYTESKHKWKQTDNINAFIEFLKATGMPSTFIFDPIDLYEKKNIPKVIFCIHVLSHLLAKQGLAERIGNLVGQFDFTDDQLAATSKGLQGVAMPNFGDARRNLAKEASWESEEPEETEDEKRDRILLENEPSIIQLQRHLRGRLARMRVSRIYSQLELAEPIILRFQARARGGMSRRTLLAQIDERQRMGGWANKVQAAARRHLATQRLAQLHQSVAGLDTFAVHLQAQARGKLARSSRQRRRNDLDAAQTSVIRIQAACRRRLATQERASSRKELLRPETMSTVTSLQSILRGRLHRQAAAQQQRKLMSESPTYVGLQSHLRGMLVRRRWQAHTDKLDNATDYIVAIQSVCRGVLARRRKLAFVSAVQQAIPNVASLQAVARGRLAKQSHATMQKALAKVEVSGSVGGFQSLLRSKLAKKQTTEQKKKLEFVQPDVIGFQAVARGYLARQEYCEWRDYLQDPHTQGALVFLQSLVRGFLARRALWQRTSYIHRNIDKVVKIQAVWRGRVQRQMYDRLLTGIDVDVPTIQNYMHLLDDTDTDAQRQIHTENLRRVVVRLIRENQSLETEVSELDTKIALILKNKMTFEELARAKHSRHNQQDSQGQESWKDNVNRDPFTTGTHLDRASQRKLELFEHLFFTLQTKPEYLSRLIFALAKDDEADKDRKVVDDVSLILFGFGHERREDYLFHKMLQVAVHEHILRSRQLVDLEESRFAIMSLASQYIRPTITPLLQGFLTDHVMRVVTAPHLDLTTDPAEIYRRLINDEETQTGMPTQKNRDLNANQVLQTDEQSRAVYIQHLQELRHLTKQLLDTLYVSTPHLPFTVRLLAREALLALRVKYPETTDEELTPSVARTAVLPFILPALIAPESYGIAQQAIGAVERRNLAAIANLITHVAAQDLSNSPRDWFIRTPLQEFIRAEGAIFRDWILDVASVEPLEAWFGANELFESTLEAKPIMITRTEIYSMLSILIRNASIVTANKPKDPIAGVLEELEGPPIDYDRSRNTVSLRLSNRLAEMQPTGPEAILKEDFVQAKRHILAVLRVQTGKSLFDVLVSRPEEVHEQQWLEEVYRDMAVEEAKKARHNLPPTPTEAGYQIESIRSLPFHEVKSRAIEFCMKLERAGKITRANAFEGMLVAIASDIRQKHHLRKMQRQDAQAMEQAFEDMVKKHQGFEEQIKSYHQFIDSSMASLQKGKKKPVFLSRQYFHQRSEAKSGKRSQFGSFRYTAHDLYTRGILLGIANISPTHFAEIYIIISSNEVGIFSLEMGSPTGLFGQAAISSAASALSASTSTTTAPGSLGREEVRMEDLLQAQFENELNLKMWEGTATFSINMLIHQINKKFYS